MSLIVVILFWKNCRLHSFHLYSKSMLFRHYISHFTSLYVYLLILILRIFKGTIAIITFLCLPQKAFFFSFFFWSVSSGPLSFFQWLQNYLWDPYLYFYIHIPSNKSRSVQCLPSHTQFCWSVFEEFFNIFSALQSFFFLIMFEIMFFMFIYVSMA